MDRTIREQMQQIDVLKDAVFEFIYENMKQCQGITSSEQMDIFAKRLCHKIDHQIFMPISKLYNNIKEQNETLNQLIDNHQERHRTQIYQTNQCLEEAKQNLNDANQRIDDVNQSLNDAYQHQLKLSAYIEQLENELKNQQLQLKQVTEQLNRQINLACLKIKQAQQTIAQLNMKWDTKEEDPQVVQHHLTNQQFEMSLNKQNQQQNDQLIHKRSKISIEENVGKTHGIFFSEKIVGQNTNQLHLNIGEKTLNNKKKVRDSKAKQCSSIILQEKPKQNKLFSQHKPIKSKNQKTTSRPETERNNKQIKVEKQSAQDMKILPLPIKHTNLKDETSLIQANLTQTVKELQAKILKLQDENKSLYHMINQMQMRRRTFQSELEYYKERYYPLKAQLRNTQEILLLKNAELAVYYEKVEEIEKSREQFGLHQYSLQSISKRLILFGKNRSYLGYQQDLSLINSQQCLRSKKDWDRVQLIKIADRQCNNQSSICNSIQLVEINQADNSQAITMRNDRMEHQFEGFMLGQLEQIEHQANKQGEGTTQRYLLSELMQNQEQKVLFYRNKDNLDFYSENVSISLFPTEKKMNMRKELSIRVRVMTTDGGPNVGIQMDQIRDGLLVGNNFQFSQLDPWSIFTAQQICLLQDFVEFKISSSIIELKQASHYLLTQNIYIFIAEINNNKQKFVFIHGKVIHFGSKVQLIRLQNYSSNLNVFKGENVMLGNGEVNILNNKLHIRKVAKRRIFKGEMQNGIWTISKVLVLKEK